MGRRLILRSISVRVKWIVHREREIGIGGVEEGSVEEV